jgi:RHS repeat-associated protein
MKGREQLFYKNPNEIPNFEKRAYLENFSKIKIFHYHTNHLGTPQELSDDKGDVVWLSYDRAWGGSFSQLNNVYNLDGLDVSADELQPFRFQGQFFDGETNLHYNRFRYYDSDVGMFISRDPIGLLGGNNVFQYAPNPVMWIDPWGLSNDTYIHYTDKAGFDAITGSNSILPNAKDKVYMTDVLMTPSQVHRDLMISNPKYVGRGEFAIIFKIDEVQKSNTKLSWDRLEYIHSGKLKLNNIIYAGKNPYTMFENLSEEIKTKLTNIQVDARNKGGCS